LEPLLNLLQQRLNLLRSTARSASAAA
jgi:hypothetical protein